MLAVGRLGAGITKDFANQSDLARDLMFGAARHTIRMSQQDIGFMFGRSDALFPESTLDRLIDFMEQRDGHVYIVLSNRGATGNSGSSYCNDVSLRRSRATCATWCRSGSTRAIPRHATRSARVPIPSTRCCAAMCIWRRSASGPTPPGRAACHRQPCQALDGRRPGLLYRLGQLYPVNLQEFGYIVDDRKAAAELLDAYWNPLWQWSQRAAVSGDGVEHCIFRAPFK